MWVDAPQVSHTLNDSASEYQWVILPLVGWLFQRYAMIQEPINSITLVGWHALNCQDTYKLRSFYHWYTVAIRAWLGVQEAERRIISPGSWLVKTVAAGPDCTTIKYWTGSCQTFFAFVSLHLVLLVGMFISYLEIYNNDGPDPNHTLVVEAWIWRLRGGVPGVSVWSAESRGNNFQIGGPAGVSELQDSRSYWS